MFGWKPEIGDPTVYGWTAVVAYAVAAACCWRAAQSGPRAERWFWFPVALLLAFLAVNKQLDLQDFLRLFGRAEATAHGWYDQRHLYQVVFVIALAATVVACALLLVSRIRGASAPLKGAAAGLVLLLAYIVIRASSLEKVDLIIDRPDFVGGAFATDAMELGAIAVIAGCALAAVRSAMRARRR